MEGDLDMMEDDLNRMEDDLDSYIGRKTAKIRPLLYINEGILN